MGNTQPIGNFLCYVRAVCFLDFRIFAVCVCIPVIKTHLGHKRRRSHICPVRAVACVIACSLSLNHFPSGFIPPIPFTFLCSHSQFHKLIAFLPTFSPFPLNIAQFTATHRRKSLTEFHKYSSSLVTGKNAKWQGEGHGSAGRLELISELLIDSSLWFRQLRIFHFFIPFCWQLPFLSLDSSFLSFISSFPFFWFTLSSHFYSHTNTSIRLLFTCYLSEYHATRFFNLLRFFNFVSVFLEVRLIGGKWLFEGGEKAACLALLCPVPVSCQNGQPNLETNGRLRSSSSGEIHSPICCVLNSPGSTKILLIFKIRKSKCHFSKPVSFELPVSHPFSKH